MQPNFLTPEICHQIQRDFSSPTYVYSEQELSDRADEFLSFPSAYGLTVRYAMKANSNRNILKLFHDKWLYIDASSSYEAERAIAAWVAPEKIQISSQELSESFTELVKTWVFFVASSLHQLEEYWKAFPWGELWVRLNPWVGSADFKQINTWGWISSFGIWHEKIDEIKHVAEKYNLKITKIHIHIGSENTPKSWVKSANIGLDFVRAFESVTMLNMGGWFKMAIMDYEKKADLQEIGKAVKKSFEDFYAETNRKIHLETEPGKYLVINSGSFLAEVNDVVDTGKYGYKFIKVNTGMNDMPRVPMYGIQQPIYIIPNTTPHPQSLSSQEREAWMEDYVVVGHCCESSDILTCQLHDQEMIEPKTLPKAEVWDLVVVDGVWAYNSAMAMKNYNSFPESSELLLRKDGTIVEMRKRQKLKDIWMNEVEVI